MCAPANEIMIDIYQITLFAVEPQIIEMKKQGDKIKAKTDS